ncbi:MAG: DNA cytosine methyltransferase [Byssovorax sp.]
MIDLFSGAGGLSLGFRAAGARIVAAVDFNESAGKTFVRNFARLQSRRPPLAFFGAKGNLETLDLADVAPQDKGPDILVGGPPCQGFSRLGRAKLAHLASEARGSAEAVGSADDPDAGDPRNKLYRRFVEAARYWRPSAVVMENVPGMFLVDGFDVADVVASDLASCGYRVGYAVLNAVWYGVPQFRERIFFIGFRNDLAKLPSVPVPTHKVDLPSGYLRPQEAITLSFDFVEHFELEVQRERAQLLATTTGQALGDLPRIIDHLAPGKQPRHAGLSGVLREYDAPAVSDYARLMRAWPGFGTPEGLKDHVIRRTPRDFETFRRMKPDDRYPEAMKIARQRLAEELARRASAGGAPAEGTDEYKALKKGIVPPYPEDNFVDKWRKLNPDRPSWTVPAHLSRDVYSHIHYDSEQARGISVREAARLQSFPDAFEFSGNMGDCFTQIGNAVPPLLAWAVASHVIGLLGFPARVCNLGQETSILTA